MGRHRLVILEMTFMKHWGTILNFVLFAFICLIICIAVWMLSGDIQNWMKLVIYAITFAAYADIRFSDRFGSNIGVRRYINPMSGQWTTSPIVTPYFRVGKRNKVEIGLPLGELLKAAVWGDRDNPMRFRPQPQPQQHPKKK